MAVGRYRIPTLNIKLENTRVLRRTLEAGTWGGVGTWVPGWVCSIQEGFVGEPGSLADRILMRTSFHSWSQVWPFPKCLLWHLSNPFVMPTGQFSAATLHFFSLNFRCKGVFLELRDVSSEVLPLSIK